MVADAAALEARLLERVVISSPWEELAAQKDYPGRGSLSLTIGVKWLRREMTPYSVTFSSVRIWEL